MEAFFYFLNAPPTAARYYPSPNACRTRTQAAANLCPRPRLLHCHSSDYLTRNRTHDAPAPLHELNSTQRCLAPARTGKTSDRTPLSQPRSTAAPPTWPKGSDIGDFGGGSLEKLRPWLSAPVAGPHSGSAELPGAARRALRRHRSRAAAPPRRAL